MKSLSGCVCGCVRVWGGPVVHLCSRVPGCGQRGVDDHVHRHQVGHRVVGGPHGPKNALPGLVITREGKEELHAEK